MSEGEGSSFTALKEFLDIKATFAKTEDKSFICVEGGS